MSDVAVVRPSGPDNSAQTLYAWGEETVNDIAAAMSLHSLHADLAGSTASRQAVENELRSCRAVFYFGHGDWDKLLNHGAAVVDTQNIGSAVDKLVIAIACKSAHTLGNAAVNAGVRGYLGFDEDLKWVTGVPQMTGIACAAGPKELLLNQSTLADAADAMRREFDVIIHYFKYGAGRNNADATFAYLWATWSKIHLCIKGDATARL